MTSSQRYPPSSNTSSSDTITLDVYAVHPNVAGSNIRRSSRTPSPTPSEAKELETGAIDWARMRNWRFWIRKEWICTSSQWHIEVYNEIYRRFAGYYVIFGIVLIISVLVTIFHQSIVRWLTPFTNWLHGMRFGWLIIIGILFVLSFPPVRLNPLHLFSSNQSSYSAVKLFTCYVDLFMDCG